MLAMEKASGGWHELVTKKARPGSLYKYILPDGETAPDPASRFQPRDAQGPSEVIDPSSYEWTVEWNGRPWTEIVLYELHVGAFTAEGTFRSAIEKLEHLAAIGVTAIQIMPVADFPGRRNWGYDGVLLYAPNSSYGRPEDFKALIEAAHRRRIAVILDVVYNHFGPQGNYLPAISPAFFDETRQTPWGAAIAYDSPHSWVREFFIQNALYWLEEFDLDGLRFDAVHAIIDQGAEHVLEEIARRVRAAQSKPIHLILENEENDPALLIRQSGAPKFFSAQWNDDLHHVLHVAATHERAGYYADYEGRTDLLLRALAEGFAFQGEKMGYRGSPRGKPAAFLPPMAFVGFIQNHDQVGNRALGERLGVMVPKHVLRALSAVYLLLPQPPMIFMGEEWGAQQPFLYFCDFEESALADAIRKGRREEFARFPQFRDPEYARSHPRSARGVDLPFLKAELAFCRRRTSRPLPGDTGRPQARNRTIVA